MLEKTITIILAGGVGSRLYPLTAERAKPAVPFGGRYRIIDFTLSNCPSFRTAPHSRAYAIQVAFAAETFAGRVVRLQSRTGRIHYACPPTDADGRIVVQLHRGRNLSEPVTRFTCK
jgi:hypothetical protein